MRRRERNPVGAELDLTPVLSTIVHIIPIVLIAVRFVTQVQHPMDSPPVHSTEAPSREKLEAQERDRVVIRVNSKGFEVRGSADAQADLACRAPCAPVDYDYRGLNDAMVAARARHPAETQVVVIPEGEVTYEVLVGVFDAVTERRDGDHVTPLFGQPVLVNGAEPTP